MRRIILLSIVLSGCGQYSHHDPYNQGMIAGEAGLSRADCPYPEPAENDRGFWHANSSGRSRDQWLSGYNTGVAKRK